MIDSFVLHLELLKQEDYFEEFLVLLQKEKKQGRNYLMLSSIPTALHYRLILENFTIKRIEKTIRYLFFFKRRVYCYRVE